MKKFYLGMDIGTESVGMACTDENYNLLRAKGKDLWAVRLFDEAKDASERRNKRTLRRRIQRRRQRIDLLQGIFAPYMTDNLFFIRLNNSGFYLEDKRDLENKPINSKYSLFADEKYNDVHFYKDFPTIYHLRNTLINGTNKRIDLRHYYLALHHIIKYRGHFLFEGDNVKEICDIKRLFELFNFCVEDLNLEFDLIFNLDCIDSFKEIAISQKSLTEKKKELAILFDISTIEKKEWLALMLGASASPKKLFGEEFFEKYKDEKSISFKKLTDDNFEGLISVFEEEHFELIKYARDIYNFIVFEKVLDGKKTISESMVALYDKHNEDLKILKEFVKENFAKETYYKIFRSTKEKANYANYIGYNKSKINKKSVSKCSTEEFYKFLKNIFNSKSVSDTETLAYINKEIENEQFLPKILNADNGLFPHQINGMELDLILENMGKQYPEFLKIDEEGFTAIEKIKKIFLFKIPYYVGPLNTANGNAWMVRNEGKNGKITPWNFDEVVDKIASNKAFIRKMTNKCTYLHNQDVLPKFSMYYQAFDTLNQLNKLTINGEPINLQLKQEIFKNVYLKNKKIKAKQIIDYLLLSGQCSPVEAKNIIIGGFNTQVETIANMSSYNTFKEKFGELVDTSPEIFENIILWHTLNTDKNLVEQCILQNYGDIAVIKNNIKWLKGLTSLKDFGRLSKKLLCEIVGGVDQATGEVYTILNRLYNTNNNFNELLFAEEYNFGQAIENENVGRSEDVTYNDVAELYVSPMVRRGIWQSLQMVDEYVQAVGKAPDKIFIEVTRENESEEKKNKNAGIRISRKNKLLELYKGISEDCFEIDELIKELNKEEINDSKLRQERLYLYFLQLGKCAYTGNPINLDELGTDLYDVDHIIPRSMTKDDSLDNKVLVERKKNEEKTNIYPLKEGFTNQQAFWKILKSKGLMSAEKYTRLTRTKPLTEEDFRAFVNRQLVITNQTTKAVAELLKLKFESQGTKIVYSKAGNVADFRQKCDIVKCRETNDLHHARDAYLNIAIGNIFDTKFSSKMAYFYADKEGVQRGYNLDKIYFWQIDGAWRGQEDIAHVKKVVSKTSMQVTRYVTIDKGKFYKETIYNKNDIKVSYPRKNSAPYNIIDENGKYKYGGYSNIQNAYFVALEYSKGKKRKKIIVGLPVVVEYQVKGDIEKIKEYFEKTEGLKDVTILVAKIKKNSLISYNGNKAYITGASDNRILLSNAIQWFTNSETDLYVKNLFKLLSMVNQSVISQKEYNKQSFEIRTNRFKKNVCQIDTENNVKLYNNLIEQISSKCYQRISTFQTLKAILENKKELFMSKKVLEQAKILSNIIQFLRRANSNGLDLSNLNESKNACRLRVSYEISNIDFKIIHQTPCGLIERVQKI